MKDSLYAEVHLKIDTNISRIGTFRFLSKPQIGERITVGDGANELSAIVYGVTHVAVTKDEDEWDGLLVLNCEISD